MLCQDAPSSPPDPTSLRALERFSCTEERGSKCFLSVKEDSGKEVLKEELVGFLPNVLRKSR